MTLYHYALCMVGAESRMRAIHLFSASTICVVTGVSAATTGAETTSASTEASDLPKCFAAIPCASPDLSLTLVSGVALAERLAVFCAHHGSECQHPVQFIRTVDAQRVTLRWSSVTSSTVLNP